MQSNASAKPAEPRPVSDLAEAPTRPPLTPTAETPTKLDLAIGCVLEGMPTRTLLDLCMDLFAKLENSLVANRQDFINSYFATLVKQDEMTSLWTDPTYYEHLRTVVQNEVLPLYDRYCAMRDKLLERTQRRSWPKFCLWTIGVCLGLELLFTGGRVLRPTMLLPAVVVDGCLGYALYYLLSFREVSALKQANQSLLNSIRAIDNKHEVAKRYEIFRSFSGGEVLTAELQLLLAAYPTPAEFWNDYFAVRKADPTSAAEMEKLNRKPFEGFLQSHIRGGCSLEARQQRFNALFLLAHKTFILNDPTHYVLTHLHPVTQ